MPKRCILNQKHDEIQDKCLVKSSSYALVRTEPYKQNDESMQENECYDDNYSQSLNDSQLPSLN